MRNLAKWSVTIALAAVAATAGAADLEFHGYARGGLGVSSRGGSQTCFALSSSGGHKLRLGNECDWVLEPSFEMAFTKLDDKSAWGVHMLPATYRRFDSGSGTASTGLPAGAVDGNLDPYHNLADGGLPVSFKEFYFFGRNLPWLSGGEIWVGRRYFDRAALGAINDQFLEAQDGVGAGVDDIDVGGAKLNFGLSMNPFTDATAGQVNDRDISVGAHVTSIQTFNKDSNLQVWARVYVPSQVEGVTKRKTGYSASLMHIAGMGAAGTLTVAGRFDQNAYTDQQNTGAGGLQQARVALVYGLNLPSARTSIDAVAEYSHSKQVSTTSASIANPAEIDWIQVGARTDTQISGPFRFLLEAGVDTSKAKAAGSKRHTLFKVTPCFAISGGTAAGSRPTFRLFYTYASWNDDTTADIAANWKSSGFASQYAGKTSGGSLGIQAEGWW